MSARRLLLLGLGLLGLLAGLHVEGLSQDRALLRERAGSKLVTVAALIAEQAQSSLADHPERVAAQLGLLSADLDVERVLLLDAAGRVELAHRRDWQGRRLSELEPGLSDEFVDLVASRQLVERIDDWPRRRLLVLMPYARAAEQKVLRNARGSLVLVALDLRAADRALLQATGRRFALQAALLLALGLVYAVATGKRRSGLAAR